MPVLRVTEFAFILNHVSNSSSSPGLSRFTKVG